MTLTGAKQGLGGADARSRGTEEEEDRISPEKLLGLPRGLGQIQSPRHAASVKANELAEEAQHRARGRPAPTAVFPTDCAYSKKPTLHGNLTPPDVAGPAGGEPGQPVVREATMPAVRTGDSMSCVRRCGDSEQGAEESGPWIWQHRSCR